MDLVLVLETTFTVDIFLALRQKSVIPNCDDHVQFIGGKPLTEYVLLLLVLLVYYPFVKSR